MREITYYIFKTGSFINKKLKKHKTLMNFDGSNFIRQS